MFDTKASVLRLRAAGLRPDQAQAIVSDVQLWIKSCGEEWTVDRVKSIKRNLLRHYAGLSPVKETADSWIHYTRNGPKRSFSVLFRLNRKQFKRAWNCIMVYSGVIFDHPVLRITDRQWEKMRSAVRRPPVDAEALVEGIRLVHESPLFVQVNVPEDKGLPLMWYKPSPSRRAPVGQRTVKDIEGVINSLDCLSRRATWTSQNMDILQGTLVGIDPIERDILECNLEDERKSGSPPLPEDYRPLMGVMALIQEPGMKLRFAANPYRVYQMALQPLGKALYDALRRVPNDYTFDQSAGVEAIQQLLIDGFPSISMDLSNASDNIPLDLQLELMSRLGVSTRWIQFYRDCCRGDWYLNRFKKGGSVETISWTVGAPLGLYPVFASFTLWHHSMVQVCFQDLGKPKVKGKWPYAIIGDDLWLGDMEVANLYVQRMLSLGIPASTSKGLVSRDVADFAGRVITPNEVIQGFKWKGRSSDESFVDYCRNIGPGALILMKPRQRKVISFIADLPEPWGLGWNPFGVPLSERLTPAIERTWSRDERVRTFERGAVWINRILHAAGWLHQAPWISNNLDVAPLASDQEALILTQQVFPGWNPSTFLWANVAEVLISDDSLSPQGRGLLRLMLQRVSSLEKKDEVPTLVQLERKIRRVLARDR